MKKSEGIIAKLGAQAARLPTRHPARLAVRGWRRSWQAGRLRSQTSRLHSSANHYRSASRLCFALLLLILPLVVSAQGPIAGEHVRVSGTKISLVPPAGFVPATGFPGYGIEEAGASIMVTEMPAPYSAITPALTDPAALAKKGMKLLAQETVTIDGRAGLLLHVEQAAYGREFLKWLLALGDEHEVVLITATFPKESEEKFSQALRQSVLSAKREEALSVPVDEGITFSVREKGAFKLAERISNTLLYTDSPVFPNKSLDAPLFVVAPSFSRLSLDDQKAFAAMRVSQIASVIDTDIIDPRPITIDGLSGYEIIASGKDKETGLPMSVYQVMLFDNGTYYLMQGIVSARRAPQYLDAFKAMARSFERRPVPIGPPPPASSGLIPPAFSTREPAVSDTKPRAPVSAGVVNGRAIKLPPAANPLQGQLKREAVVEVKVLIDETGKVTWARAVTGHALLRAAATQAAFKAEFRPVLLSGQPVKISGVIIYRFGK